MAKTPWGICLFTVYGISYTHIERVVTFKSLMFSFWSQLGTMNIVDVISVQDYPVSLLELCKPTTTLKSVVEP